MTNMLFIYFNYTTIYGIIKVGSDEMKNLTINTPFDNADLTSKKARLISIVNNKILVCNYAGFYMLPGGKVDGCETYEEAIIREIKEETGNTLSSNELKPFISVDNYQKNYLSRSNPKPINKRTTTIYFELPEKLIIHGSSLSPLEKKDNMRTFYMDIDELKSLLSSEVRPKHRVFASELLAIINEYVLSHPLIDLHTHTTYSDGEYTPNEVIEKARQKNIGTLAITDHDNIDSLKTIDYDKYDDIRIIPGVELTAKVDKGRMHILGYLIDYYNDELNNFLKIVRENNINNLKNIVEYLKFIGITFKQDELNQIYNRQSNIGRPDIAKLLIKYGYVKTMQEAFDQYLIEAFNESRGQNKGYSYDVILDIIKKANGISILAHPTSLELNHEDFEGLIKDMIACGLRGLEVFHPNVPIEEREFLMDMVNKYNLLYSAGSDFHGEHVKEDISLATGRGDLLVRDASVLQYINKNK